MKMYGGMYVYIRDFSASVLVGGEWSALRPGLFTVWKESGYSLQRRLVGPHSQTGPHGKLKFLTLPGLEPRSLDRPARSQSLYRLRYSGL
jgi:hypothetical protein